MINRQQFLARVLGGLAALAGAGKVGAQVVHEERNGPQPPADPPTDTVKVRLNLTEHDIQAALSSSATWRMPWSA